MPRSVFRILNVCVPKSTGSLLWHLGRTNERESEQACCVQDHTQPCGGPRSSWGSCWARLRWWRPRCRRTQATPLPLIRRRPPQAPRAALTRTRPAPATRATRTPLPRRRPRRPRLLPLLAARPTSPSTLRLVRLVRPAWPVLVLRPVTRTPPLARLNLCIPVTARRRAAPTARTRLGLGLGRARRARQRGPRSRRATRSLRALSPPSEEDYTRDGGEDDVKARLSSPWCWRR